MNNKYFLLSIIISVFFALIIINDYGNKVNSQLYNYVNEEAKRLSQNIVSYSVNKILEENLTNDLFIITKNSQNEIEILDYNTKEVNRLLRIVTQTVQKDLVNLEEGNTKNFLIAKSFKKANILKIRNGIICEIPLGAIKENSLYSNFGPTIPIRMNFEGSVNSYISTKITPYGYNSLVVEITLNIEITEKITMPINSKISKNKIKLPLTLKIIQGIIPKYYYEKGIEKNSQLYSTNN